MGDSVLSQFSDGICIGGTASITPTTKPKPMETQAILETLKNGMNTTQLEIPEEALEVMCGGIIVNPDHLEELVTIKNG